MGVNGGTMQQYQSLIQWDCESQADSPDQYWSFVSADSCGYQTGLFFLQNSHDTTWCASSLTNADYESGQGQPLYLDYCTCNSWPNVSYDTTDIWYLENEGDNAALSTLHGLVAAVTSASTSEGAAIILWDDQTGDDGQHPEQLWGF